jgi:hypothetical protein
VDGDERDGQGEGREEEGEFDWIREPLVEGGATDEFAGDDKHQSGNECRKYLQGITEAQEARGIGDGDTMQMTIPEEDA